MALAMYCGLARPKPIFGTVPHGWLLDFNYEKTRLGRLPVFVWNRRHLMQAEEEGRTVTALGAPFAYLAKCLWPDGDYPVGAGTLVFQSHTAEQMFRGEGTAKETIAMTEENFPGPYSVSIFYQDINGNDAQTFRQRGWRVLCFGYRYSPEFLVRQAIAIAQHRFVISEGYGSNTFYAMLMGKTSLILRDPRQVYEIERISSGVDGIPLENRVVQSNEARQVGEYELGWSLLLPPEQVLNALGWSSVRRSSIAWFVHRSIDLRYGKNGRRGHFPSQV